MLRNDQRIERRILAYLATSPKEGGWTGKTINPNKIIQICVPSLLKEEGIQSIGQIHEVLFSMEGAGLIERLYREDYRLTDQGFLQFKLFLEPFEHINENRKSFLKFADSSLASKEIKKEVKDFLKSLKGNSSEIVNGVIQFVRQNPELLHEIIQIVEMSIGG